MGAQSGSFRPDLGQPLTEGPILELALETLSGPQTLTVRFKHDDYFREITYLKLSDRSSPSVNKKRTATQNNTMNTRGIITSLIAIFSVQHNVVTAGTTAKKCTGGTCDVPQSVDCSTYAEVIISSPISGKPIAQDRVVLAVWNPRNCTAEGGNLKSHYFKSISISGTVRLAFTGTVTLNGSLKGSIGVPLLANAELTAGITTGLSVTADGSLTETVTDSATWDPDVPPCHQQTGRLLASWIDGKFGATAYVHSYYFENFGLFKGGSWGSTDCDFITGDSFGVRKYTSWGVETTDFERCCN